MEPEVEFICHPDRKGDIPEPEASSNVLPTWYKRLGAMFDSGGFTDRSVRACPAFLDSLSLGWMLPFEEDITVMADEDGVEIDSAHVVQSEVGDGSYHDDFVCGLKAKSSWAIRVPDGYSVMVMQPMNRRETRFDVIARLLDEPKGTLEVPLLWRAGSGNTVIREGDPLAQVIPFKRDTRITDAVARPFRSDGLRSYERNTKKSDMNRSWYRENEWTPKSTRAV